MQERHAIALTLWGEARGERVEGRIAVASVLRNRWRLGRWGATYEKVCRAPFQFSCWNADDPNAPKLAALASRLEAGTVPDDKVLRECLWIADGLLADVVQSNVGPATHYYATWLTRPPRWIAGALQTAAMGQHLFFANVK